MDFDQWLQMGLDSGFCSNQFCATHDSPPVTEAEYADFDGGYDPCVMSVRLGSPADWENERMFDPA